MPSEFPHFWNGRSREIQGTVTQKVSETAYIVPSVSGVISVGFTPGTKSVMPRTRWSLKKISSSSQIIVDSVLKFFQSSQW